MTCIVPRSPCLVKGSEDPAHTQSLPFPLLSHLFIRPSIHPSGSQVLSRVLETHPTLWSLPYAAGNSEQSLETRTATELARDARQRWG